MYEEKSHVGMFNCYFCGEAAGVLLDRRLQKTLPSDVGVIDTTPCSKCKNLMKKGIILISIKDDTTEEEMHKKIPNPYRTGGWAVITENAFLRIFDGDMQKWGLKHRFLFITDGAWDMIKLPRVTQNEQSA